MNLYHRCQVSILLTIIFVTLGCSGGGSSSDVPTDQESTNAGTTTENSASDELLEVTTTITSVDGARIFNSNQQLIFEVPANAVSESVEITVQELLASEQPESSRLHSSAIALTGSITQFLELPFLSIPLDNVNAANNMSVQIAELVDDHWFPLPGTETVEGVARAKIHRLSTYAVILEPITAVEKTIGPSCDTTASSQTISFVHVADLHSLYGIKNKYSYAKIRAYYLSTLEKNPYTLFTNSGDDFEKGAIAETLSQGDTTITVTKAMEFDIRTLGNHDFAWGKESLLDFVDDSDSIVLTSNTLYQASNYESFSGVEFAQVTIGCLKIGFLGLVGKPWNEFDKEFHGHYLDDVSVDLWPNQVAERLIEEHKDDVDLMVILSHLGWGTDQALAAAVNDIDVILGGHSHAGVQYSDNINNTILMQPHFFAQGIDQLDIVVDLSTNAITEATHLSYSLDDLEDIDADLQNIVDNLVQTHSPDAHVELAEVQNFQTSEEVAHLVATAAKHVHQVSNALLDPSLAQSGLKPGGLAQQDAYFLYPPERQKSNTSSFNSLYQVSATGEQINQALEAQPDWLWDGVETIDPTQEYSLLLHKAAALNSEFFFGDGMIVTNVSLASETWYVLDQYSRHRHEQCLYLDQDEQRLSCETTNVTSIWRFTNDLVADYGTGDLRYYDPATSDWAIGSITISDTDSLDLPSISSGQDRVLSFPSLTSIQGLIITPNSPANGDYASSNKLSNYTLIMDLLWPASSDGQWRALMQTDTSNTNDSDLFVENENSGGIGIGGYFGTIQTDTWHRIAIVVYAAPNNGIMELYIDGIQVGELSGIDERWALNTTALLLTDNNNETQPGYLSGILFSGRALTAAEIETLGSTETLLDWPLP